MKKRVTFTIELPDDVSDDEVTEWLRFLLHETHEIRSANPLVVRRTILEAEDVIIDPGVVVPSTTA